MKDNIEKFYIVGFGRPFRLGALATWLLAASLSAPAIALAQNVQPPPPGAAGSAEAVPSQAAPQTAVPAAPAAPAAPTARQGRGLFPLQPPPPDRPGFIYAFGQWWDSARGKLEDMTKQSDDAAKGAATATQDAVKSAAQATKEAATALFRLPGTRVVEVHQRCEIAPNGAPDCGTAATKACRAKGFGTGHPVNVESSQNCPPSVWMSGREPAAGECPEETVVLMVACQ